MLWYGRSIFREHKIFTVHVTCDLFPNITEVITCFLGEGFIHHLLLFEAPDKIYPGHPGVMWHNNHNCPMSSLVVLYDIKHHSVVSYQCSGGFLYEWEVLL